MVDSSILQLVIDLMCTMLKRTKESPELKKIVEVFPNLLSYVGKSDDMFLLLHGTNALRTFISIASK